MLRPRSSRRHADRWRPAIEHLEERLVLDAASVLVGEDAAGSFVSALVIGIVDTLGRAYLPAFFKTFMSASDGATVGSSLASIAIYLLMAVILVLRPQGLFSKL